MKDTTAKVVRFNQTGDACVLNIEQLPVLHPGDNEVRIKVAAIGINRADVMFRNGAYLEAPQFPSKLGYEASGIIECVGNNVDTFKVGDRVSTIPAFSMSQYGVYGERVIVPVEAVEKCPSSLSMEQSAAIWMQYITAYGALIDVGQLQSGQTILITAASSSVGVAAIQIAKNLGAIVVASTRGESKKQFLLSQGADHVIQTDTEDLVTAMATITNNCGAELIFDPIGGPILSQLAEVASMAGRIIEYGALDTAPTPYPLFTALAKGLIIQGYTIFETSKEKDKLSTAKAYLLPLFEDNKIIPVIDKVFSFDDIQDAHRYMESNQQKGKIIVSMN
jgi:NADPH:quinone reductase-like Zn-dependent oxidoreductase